MCVFPHRSESEKGLKHIILCVSSSMKTVPPVTLLLYKMLGFHCFYLINVQLF